MRINRDVIVAIVLLLVCAVFYGATFTIRETSYGTVGSEVWPRIIIAVLTLCTLIYLGKSVGTPPSSTGRIAAGGMRGFYATYRNAIWCFVAYGAFLAVLPYLGMLIGGILFVFGTLSLLGEWRVRDIVAHGAISVLTVGAMWAIFTFGLRVILPEGELFRAW